jgi:hypothetical protein
MEDITSPPRQNKDNDILMGKGETVSMKAYRLKCRMFVDYFLLTHWHFNSRQIRADINKGLLEN